MKIEEARQKLARLIVGYNVGIVVLIIVCYIARWLDLDDFSLLASVLVPISAIYIGAMFQFLGQRVQADPNKPPTQQRPDLNNREVSLVKSIVQIHFVLLTLIIIAKIIPLINAKEMSLLFTLIEGSFGGYIGYVINSVFNVKVDRQ